MYIILLIVFVCFCCSEEIDHVEITKETMEEKEGGGCGCGAGDRGSVVSSSLSSAEDLPNQCDDFSSKKDAVTTPACELADSNMVRINGAVYWQGTNLTAPPDIRKEDGGPVANRAWNHIQDGEYPARRVKVDSFFLDQTEVTNAQFWEFVQSTGHKTDAENYGWSFVFQPHLTEEQDKSIDQAVANAPWWLPVKNANWRTPEGDGRPSVLEKSDLSCYNGEPNRLQFPVIHVSWQDAVAFCQWRNGARLPTEAEWELAARDGRHQAMWPWGHEIRKHGNEHQSTDHGPNGHMANLWQGEFPLSNSQQDGFECLAPVGSFPASEFGLYDMIGNVWEWVADPFKTTRQIPRFGRAVANPGRRSSGASAVRPGDNNPRFTEKGGSFLCHPSYCFRSRTSARHSAESDSSTTNLGFRCAKDIIP